MYIYSQIYPNVLVFIYIHTHTHTWQRYTRSNGCVKLFLDRSLSARSTLHQRPRLCNFKVPQSSPLFVNSYKYYIYICKYVFLCIYVYVCALGVYICVNTLHQWPILSGCIYMIHVCKRVYICVYAYMHIYLNTYTHVHLYMCMWIHMFPIYMYILNIYFSAGPLLWIYKTIIYMYINMYICIYTYTHLCLYVYAYL